MTRTHAINPGNATARPAPIARVCLWLCVALCAIVWLKNAWVCDDAYIVLRSVEQVFDGNGPRWNPHERAQAFTSPLWFMVLCMGRLLFSDGFLLTVTVSALCILALGLVLRATFDSRASLTVCLLLLVASNSFFDFTSSGLENPLTYLLVGLFLLASVRSRAWEHAGVNHRWIRIALYVAGLTVVCRHDLLTLVGIPAALLAVRLVLSRGWVRALPHFAISACPLALWTLFSFVYYGMPLPNTYYAKLHAGVPTLALMSRGMEYLATTAAHDPVAMVLLVLGPLACLIATQLRAWPLAAAVPLNLLYVVSAGGDFMAGRFVSTAYLWSVVLVVVFSRDAALSLSARLLHPESTLPHIAGRATIVALMVYLLAWHHTPVNTSLGFVNRTITGDVADERGFYYAESSLLSYVKRDRRLAFPATAMSMSGRRLAMSSADVIPALRIGAFGYWAGTRKIVLDPMALADPFLARQPIAPGSKWRVGHYLRPMPPGYVESVRTGKPLQADPVLNAFYERMATITRSPRLFTRDRIRAIVALNTGRLRARP